MTAYTELPTKYRVALWLSLIAGGLLGNHFKYPIFLNIDFLFGGIFAMLALQFFGLGRGILAAALMASYTYVLWNHPYAALILTAEVAVVGALMQRHKMGMVLADTLFWLLIGIPLVVVFYHFVMHVSLANTTLTMTKQAVNGIANALLARLIFIGLSLRLSAARTSFREIIYNLMAFFVLCPALIMLGVGSRADFEETDLRIRSALAQQKQAATGLLSNWVENRKSTIVTLASIAADHSPQQMQSYLEQAKRSDVNFLRVGLIDRDAMTTAFFPRVDELGQHNVGKNFSDRPFIPVLRQTLQPMLTEVFTSRIGSPKPIVTLVAPVLRHAAYGGFVTGVLGLDQIGQQLDQMASANATLYTLLDRNERVILTNRAGQTAMLPLAREPGELRRLDASMDQWLPQAAANTPISERWKNSYYVAQSGVGDFADWRLVLEQPVAPFQKALFDSYAGKLTLLFLVLLGALALAELLSRRAVLALEKLSAISLALTLGPQTRSQPIEWPQSAIVQTQHLIENFRTMSQALNQQFQEIEQINETLEARVLERTQALAANEERFRRFFEGNSSVMLFIDPESGRIEEANAAALAYYGYPEADLIGMAIADVNTLSPESVAREMALASAQKRNYFLFQHRLASAAVRDVEVYSTPIETAGRMLLFSIVHDITERKEAEQLLRGAIDVIDEAFVLYDAQDRLLVCNDKYRSLYASSSDLIVVGARFEDIVRHGAERGQYQAAVGRVHEWVAERMAAHRSGNIALVQHLDDGHVLRVLERKLPGGQTVGFRIDITDLVRATEAAQAASLAKSRFLATMSHEIRTPMNGILGMAQLLLMPELTQSERFDHAHTILACGQSLLALLNDILDLSKIEAGKLQLDATECEPELLVRETCALFVGAAQSRGLQLDGQWNGPSERRYQVDAHRLRQMLSNLVGNAIKFTPQGHVRIEAREVECDGDGALLEFCVSDTGIGIEPDKLDLLFKPFSQTDSSTTRHFGGTGLGLSIVRNLARAMGGDAGVQSKAGEGSRFWFRVRVPVVAAGAAPVLPAAARDDAFRGRVLVVEDHAVNRRFIQALLSKLGLQVQLALDGQQALDAVMRCEPFDLVLMDINMPVMDGYTATQRIREWEAQQGRARLTILALTADAFEEDRQRCLAAGMDDFLSKPVAVDTLKGALRQWLAATPPARVDATPAVALPALERAQFLALLDEITPLLEQNKFDAIARFAGLKALARGTALQGPMQEMEALVKALRFEGIPERLRALVSAPAPQQQELQ